MEINEEFTVEGTLISVIIPTRNRAGDLRRCLESLETQSMAKPDFEVLVADNASSDETCDVCKEFSSRFGNFKYLFETTLGQHAGRHAGLKHAKGEILTFADDDIIASKNWLEGVKESFGADEIAMVGGKNLPKYEGPRPGWFEGLWIRDKFGKRLGYYSLLDFGDETKKISPVFIYGCNLSIRRAVLNELGGFHPDVMPKELVRYTGDGDTGLSRAVRRRGYSALYNPKATVYHLVPKSRLTESYLEYRLFTQGVADSYSQIRKSGGIRTRDELVGLVRRVRSKWKRGLQRDVKHRIRESYWRGYTYHRSEVKKDPSLLEWVLRESYLENGKP